MRAAYRHSFGTDGDAGAGRGRQCDFRLLLALACVHSLHRIQTTSKAATLSTRPYRLRSQSGIVGHDVASVPHSVVAGVKLSLPNTRRISPVNVGELLLVQLPHDAPVFLLIFVVFDESLDAVVLLLGPRRSRFQRLLGVVTVSGFVFCGARTGKQFENSGQRHRQAPLHSECARLNAWV